MKIDYVRYLEAKRTVDGRALDIHCLQKFRQALQSIPSSSTIRIVELGAGTGTMLRRLIRDFDKFFVNPVEFTLIDIKADALAIARRLLLNCDAQLDSAGMSDNSISIHHSGVDGTIPDIELPGLLVRFKRADVFEFLRSRIAKFDAVIAASFLDLVSLDDILPIIKNCIDPSSLVRAIYCPLTFNGVTIFSSVPNDSPILRAFHSSMGRGTAGGVDICRAYTGNYLRAALKMINGQAIAMADSNWNVVPKNGMYQNDEMYFVQCILQFVASTSKDELSRFGVTANDVDEFMKDSLNSLRQKTLSYSAHNVDFVGVFQF